MGLGKFGLGTAGAAAAPETGGFSAALTWYGYASGVGNFGAAAADFYGVFSGNVEAAEHYSNAAAVATSVSGGTTYLVTGDFNAAVTAADIESLGVNGVQLGVGAAEGEGPSLADIVDTVESGAGLLEPGKP